MRSPTKAKLAAELKTMDPGLEPGTPMHDTAMILLASLVVGPSVEKVAAFLGLPRPEVLKRATRLRANGVWRGGKVRADWFDDKSGGVAFWCDCAVAEGLLVRA